MPGLLRVMCEKLTMMSAIKDERERWRCRQMMRVAAWLQGPGGVYILTSLATITADRIYRERAARTWLKIVPLR